jgi:hypothetical protein
MSQENIELRIEEAHPPQVAIVWVDVDSGTFGVGLNSIRVIRMTAEEVDNFQNLTDSERVGFALDSGFEVEAVRTSIPF